jgi:hypothetical protein
VLLKRALAALCILAAVSVTGACGDSGKKASKKTSAGGSTTSTLETTTTVTLLPVDASTTSSSSTSSTASTSSTTSTTKPPPSTTSTAIPVYGSGVRGRVTAGPTCPVERPDQPCPPRPVEARVDAFADNRQVAGTQADADGRYALTLPPGRYTLTATTGAELPRCNPTEVTVVANQVATADISCDTGIR